MLKPATDCSLLNTRAGDATNKFMCTYTTTESKILSCLSPWKAPTQANHCLLSLGLFLPCIFSSESQSAVAMILDV